MDRDAIRRVHKLFLDKKKPMSQLIVRKFYFSLLLWMLSKEEMHGYGIIKRMESLDLGTVKASRIYPMLAELEKLKLVTKRKEGRRVLYKASSRGKDVLKRLKKYLNNNPIGEFLRELVA
ncbi:MAG: hypothetical protein D6769_03000 [Methanobacteriota archaeon]|nr:MAG: hypothetical protein D6769_03000 [Euryarchaeota archaeon]